MVDHICDIFGPIRPKVQEAKSVASITGSTKEDMTGNENVEMKLPEPDISDHDVRNIILCLTTIPFSLCNVSFDSKNL